MKLYVLSLTLLLCFLTGPTTAQRQQRQRSSCTQRYRLTVFNTATNGPNSEFPRIRESIHFSPLVAASHKTRYTPFILYGYASRGVQNVAETGSTTQLNSELMRAKSQRFVNDIAIRGSLLFAPDSYSVVLTATCTMPYVSFITMVAPSPDWFVGGTRKRVRQGNKFVDRLSGMLRVYDAGTDSGRTLSAANKETRPKENIAPLWGMPFMGKPVGRWVLEKL